jgi:hypothetical protein
MSLAGVCWPRLGKVDRARISLSIERSFESILAHFRRMSTRRGNDGKGPGISRAAGGRFGRLIDAFHNYGNASLPPLGPLPHSILSLCRPPWGREARSAG